MNMLTTAFHFILLSFLASKLVNGQIVGVDVCSCTPTIYKFILNFTLVCPSNVDAATNEAIFETSCTTNISVPDTPSTDLVPVSVSRVTIAESNENGETLEIEVFEGEYVSGDEIEFASSIVNEEDVAEVDDIPRTLTVTTLGTNAGGVPLTNVYGIRFTNDCSASPVFTPGDYAGWTYIEEESPPLVSLCPASEPDEPDEPTAAPTRPAPDIPTGSPSGSPTAAGAVPTTTPTAAAVPTATPTEEPPEPTASPTVSETDSPTVSPTEEPPEPTASPTVLGTDSPTVSPTTLPTVSSTTSPTESPTDDVESEPTEAPVDDIMSFDVSRRLGDAMFADLIVDDEKLAFGGVLSSVKEDTVESKSVQSPGESITGVVQDEQAAAIPEPNAIVQKTEVENEEKVKPRRLRRINVK